MICRLAPGLHVSKFSRGQSLGDPSDSKNEGEGEDEDEDSDSGDTPLKLQINLTTEVEREVDLFLESEEVLAALKRLVNGYSVSPAKLIMDDDDDQSVDM